MSSTAIYWPSKYLPGTTDHFISNEVIVANLSADDVWPLLVDVTAWQRYYWNCSHVTPPRKQREYTKLEAGDRFSFSTFGIGPFPAECFESLPPTASTPGRLAWRGWVEADDATSIDVYHAWIVENLIGGRVRILTQESQIGKPAAQLAAKRPNNILNGHQDWLDSLVKAAQCDWDHVHLRSLS